LYRSIRRRLRNSECILNHLRRIFEAYRTQIAEARRLVG